MFRCSVDDLHEICKYYDAKWKTVDSHESDGGTSSKVYLMSEAVLAMTSANGLRSFKRRVARDPTFNPQMIWMTVNFKPEVSIEQAVKCLRRLSSRKFMLRYWYNIEQRASEGEPFHGFHSHWLISTDHPKSAFERDVRNTVKYFIGTAKSLDIEYIPVDWKDDKLEYLNGDKWAPDKHSKVVRDREFRQEYNLAPLYTNAISEGHSAENCSVSQTPSGECEVS